MSDVNMSDINPHVEVYATITDRHGDSETVYAGSLPTWAWADNRQPEWRKAKRTMLLANRTSDPRGWRVRFAVPEEPQEESQ